MNLQWTTWELSRQTKSLSLHQKEELKEELKKIGNNMTKEQISDMLHNELSFEWLEDCYDRSSRTYDLELFFDNIDEACIKSKPVNGYMNFEDYLKARKWSEKEFFDKWISIIRETKEGERYIDKVLDYQNDSIGKWIGFRRAEKYTDEEIKEFFRSCWYS